MRKSLDNDDDLRSMTWIWDIYTIRHGHKDATNFKKLEYDKSFKNRTWKHDEIDMRVFMHVIRIIYTKLVIVKICFI